MTTKVRWLAMALLMGTVGSALAAGEDRPPQVSVNTTASIEKMPEIARLKIEIAADGPDLKQALAKLKAKRESAIKKLKDLGITDSAFNFEGPRLSEDQAEAMRKRIARMRGRPDRSPDAEEGDKKPPKVNVAQMLQAEWPVKAEDSESLLVFASDLQEKIKKADLAGLKNDKASEEDEEKLAEMKEQLSRYDNTERILPGEPVIVYVCKITDADRSKLLADAFARAKAEASQLAAVAGMQLDSLASLTSHQSGSGEDYSGYGQSVEPYQTMRRARAMVTPENMNKENISVEPRKITCRTGIMVTYRLK